MTIAYSDTFPVAQGSHCSRVVDQDCNANISYQSFDTSIFSEDDFIYDIDESNKTMPMDRSLFVDKIKISYMKNETS